MAMFNQRILTQNPRNVATKPKPRKMQFNLEKQDKPNKQGLKKLKTTCFNHQNNKK
jgi:hypothetical protein